MKHCRKKPYILLNGEPILNHTLRRIGGVSGISQIIITVHAGEERFCENNILQGLSLSCPIRVVAGGAARQDSVRNALSYLNEDAKYVLIHDGARPLIPETLVQEVISETVKKKAVTVAVPVKDTITSVSLETSRLERVLPRETIYAVQTPQCFEKALILDAHRKALNDRYYGTDDASLVMRMGVDVFVVKGVYDNIKITTPEDLLIAEAILERHNKCE